mmetsp:Transcript_73416/g.174937  ORF Transcript_73416/g.174937 Transcript_73416/m.174937 type:complete len:206 (+) Transcript_73416:862-1479(+)
MWSKGMPRRNVPCENICFTISPYLTSWCFVFFLELTVRLAMSMSAKSLSLTSSSPISCSNRLHLLIWAASFSSSSSPYSSGPPVGSSPSLYKGSCARRAFLNHCSSSSYMSLPDCPSACRSRTKAALMAKSSSDALTGPDAPSPDARKQIVSCRISCSLYMCSGPALRARCVLFGSLGGFAGACDKRGFPSLSSCFSTASRPLAM